MAHVTGNTGSITLPATIGGKVIEWSATVEIDPIVIPPAFGEKWETAEPGIGRVTGSLRAKIKFNEADSQPVDLTGADWSSFKGNTVLTAAATCTITGTMLFTNCAFTLARAGYMEMTADFRNADIDCVVAWDETP